MNLAPFRPLLLTAALVLATGAAIAQDVPAPATTAAPVTAAAPVVADVPVRTLAPFDARYAVYRDGKPLGDANLQLVSLGESRWRVDLRIEATRGLMGLA